MRRILSKAVAFILILSMFTAAFAFMPFAANENIAMAADIKTYYNMLKDYNKTLAHNKEIYKKQRIDDDAIKKYATNSLNDKDINALAKQITSSKKSEYDKIKAIYNWVAENIYYDQPLYRDMKKNKQSLDVVSGDPKVIYERRYAICGGYTAFTVALLRAVGIAAKGVSGVVNSDSQFGHGWTEAWVSKDKRWLIMDTTWGSGNSYDNGRYSKGSVRSKYFDMSLETLSKTHIMTSTGEVKNKVYYHYNIKNQKDMYVELPYKSATTYKTPPKNPGYTFDGWYKDEALTKKWDFEKEKLLTDVHLYAKWIPITYTVKFDSNGGTPVESVKAKYGERLTKPKDPTRKGYIFGGWTFTKNGNDFWNFVREPGIHTVTKNITLYASWQTPYTITFDSDGGTPVPSAKTGYNGKVPTPTVTPTKEGYTFAGWYYKKNAKESDRPVYFGEVSVKADTTFYARWIPGGGTPNTKDTAPKATPTPIATPTPKPPTGITPDYTAAPLENGTYNIHPAANTKLSFDMERSSMLDVTALIYYTNTTNDNQKFNLTRVGDYLYTITLVHSGKNLTSSGIMGGQLKQSQADGNYKQVFTIMKYSDGYYRIQDFEGYFAGTSGGNAKSNTSVIMWEEDLDCSQALVFSKLDTAAPAVLSPTPIPTPTPTLTPTQQYYYDMYATGDTIEDGLYTINSYISSILTVDVPNSSKKEGTALILFGSTNNDNQKFTLKKVGDKQYTITAKHSGLNWTSPGVAGGKITQGAPNNSSSQIFTITKANSSNAYVIQDSTGLSVGFPIGVPEKEGNLVLKKEASDMFEWFILIKEDRPAPPPTPTPTPTPTPKPTEPSLIPNKLESITHSTATNPDTIKDGWYHLVVNNNYIRAYNDKPILSKEEYANYFKIESLGGRIYSLRSAYGSFLSIQYKDIRNGDEVTLKWVDDSYLITGWIIEPVDLKKNLFTIRPLDNKDFVLSAENGKLVLTKNPSSTGNTRFTIFPYKP